MAVTVKFLGCVWSPDTLRALSPDCPLYFQKDSLAGPDQSLVCSFLHLMGDKWGRSGPRGWCVIPRDDPLVLYVYAAPQVRHACPT